MSTSNPEDAPIWYHREDTIHCYNVLLAGESQAFVAVGSSGKSNFARHIIRDEVKADQIKNIAPHHNIFVMLDPHQLVHLEQNALELCGKSWTGYELMLHRMNHALDSLDDLYERTQRDFEARREFERAEVINQARAEVTALLSKTDENWGHMFHPLNPLSLQSSVRRIEAAVEAVLDSKPKPRLIFVFDELEEFFRVLPVSFFQSLRGLRDNYKRRLLFITFSRSSPFEMMENMADKDQQHALEGFVELLTDFTHYMRPLDRDSADHLMKKFEKRYGYQYGSFQQELLFSVTGLHAGLIRRSYLAALQVLGSRPSLTVEALADAIVPYEKVQKECATIDTSLTPRERAALREIVRGRRSADTIATGGLVRKHLLSADTGTLRIPLLSAYVRQIKP